MAGVDALLITIATRDPAQAYTGALCALVGSLAGSLFLFAIARKGGEVLLQKHISSRRGARMHAWFERYGLVTVFLPAVSPFPMPMKVPVFCAGALQVRWSYFTSVVLSARAIRYFTLAYLGRHFGQQTFAFLAKHLVAAILITIVLASATVLLFQFLAHRRTLGQAAQGQ